MSTIIKEVLFNDGEGLDFGDLNNAQRFERAYLMDLLLGGLLRGAEPGVTPETDKLYAIGMGGAAKFTANAREVSNEAGLIIQCTGVAFDGSDPKVLAYYVDAAELLQVVDTEPGGNPRIDIISVKLEQESAVSTTRDFEDAVTRAKTSTSFSKQRRVKITKTYTKGTPAASPSEPAVPAGHVKWCSVRIASGGASAVLNLNGATTDWTIHDQRFPAPYAGSSLVLGKGMTYDATHWTLNADGTITANAAGRIAYAFYPGPRRAGRLLKVDVEALISAGGSIDYVRRNLSTMADSALEQIAATLGGGGATARLIDAPAWATWCQGFSGAFADGDADTTVQTMVAVKFTSGANNDKVNFARFISIG